MNTSNSSLHPNNNLHPSGFADYETWLQAVSDGWRKTGEHLLHQRNSAAHWEGHLSSSALSTATAVMALDAYVQTGQGTIEQRVRLHTQCEAGRQWLIETQNPDGGWGDTTLSLSNISTTALVWASLPANDPQCEIANSACEAWLLQAVNRSLSTQHSSLNPGDLAEAVKRRYGKDHTFSVPILTALALHGRLGDLPEAWRQIPQLPFELAAFPRAWYAKLRLRVVSYALPALIAIGLVRFRQFPGRNWPWIGFRRAVTGRVLNILREIQPASGGYLEAIPLTSFVCMSLIRAGLADSPVVKAGIEFLEKSFRQDGSWAIDTNLATWASTLAVSALERVPDAELDGWNADAKSVLKTWLLKQQYQTIHPFTQAAPGGWAWTNLSGGVPDADDTPGALLALAKLGDPHDSLPAARSGIRWLLGTQNRDGGMPTFCRGWGQLPFDRSSADLTAHALRAWQVWYSELSTTEQTQVRSAIDRGIKYLLNTQRSDGAWVPLWFGNQNLEEEENPVYGTSRVLLAWAELSQNLVRNPTWDYAALRAWDWLLEQQNPDGGWGGGLGAGGTPTPTSIEETGLALDAISRCVEVANTQQRPVPSKLINRSWSAMEAASQQLIELTRNGFQPAPIGFYFAKLWYFETTYPIVFALNGLGGVLNCLRQRLSINRGPG